ncbi:hypothetical protein NLI96_g772 [Meripilus lineatus]|uniref:Uncharacterized protein n=1 Tax=Meripilus lineatus TaxID=2056292 RepID=A0AAD5VBP9_9APHY|nr:hypothetical protein NLI96_g772 [Physisporinus lineatus]
MLTLEGEVKELYKFAYGEEEYNRHCDTPGTVHGSKSLTIERSEEMTRSQPPPFVHQPYHDAESLYWVLVDVLLHAQPLERTNEVDLGNFWGARKIIHDHAIFPKPYFDPRDKF